MGHVLFLFLVLADENLEALADMVLPSHHTLFEHTDRERTTIFAVQKLDVNGRLQQTTHAKADHGLATSTGTCFFPPPREPVNPREEEPT